MDRAAASARGFFAGVTAVALVVVASLPARVVRLTMPGGAMQERVERVVAGTLIDAAGGALWIAPLVALGALVAPFVARRLRAGAWQAHGPLVVAAPLAVAFWSALVAAHETHRERGAFPTLFDVREAESTSFLRGALGFLLYERVWLPALVSLVLVAAIVAVRRGARAGRVSPWRPWAIGVFTGLLSATAALNVAATAQEALGEPFTAAAVGDPVTVLAESGLDIVAGHSAPTARELVASFEPTADTVATGGRLLVWPSAAGDAPCGHDPRARPVDPALEGHGDGRGQQLRLALGDASRALFADGEPPVALVEFSLEGFRADDIHALHAAAPNGLAPFVNGLYAQGPADGVLAGRHVFQAGVRTAHGLGALTCGLGTLPYNLSLIRDLQPFPVRCTSDVLADAGFSGTFFYGSDAAFDGMAPFLAAHGYPKVIAQAALPATSPHGTWGAVTDFALFDEAARVLADGLATNTPQLALVMSLSNHSPFTLPDDLPADVRARADEALATTKLATESEDRLRATTFSYTDAALARFFHGLDERGISERTIVVLAADHSTGHNYVWGDGEDTDEAKAQIPFVVVIPPPFLARLSETRRVAAVEALTRAQALLDAGPLSQNDVPAIALALLSQHPRVRALPDDKRWHTLGGQITSPSFQPGGAADILGINGVSRVFALDKAGARIGGYEESVFLATRADRARVTPRLIPIAAALSSTMRRAEKCAR